MRETRTSGSVGGGDELNRLSLPQSYETRLHRAASVRREVSEVEAVDVRFRELQWRPENDLAAANLDLAQTPTVHRQRARVELALRK